MLQSDAVIVARAAFVVAAFFTVGPGFAQVPSALSGYSGENANKPIDIESDRLEVDDKKQVAIFTGSVSATQGDYNLKSRQLEVLYERGSGEGQSKGVVKPVKASQTADASVGSGQVQTIKATGSVVVTSQKDDQKATGNEGLFEVKEQKIVMTGDVVLIQKGNIVKCDKLNIDLETSRAVCVPLSVADGKGGKKPRVTAVLQRDGGGGSTTNPMEAISGKKKSKAEKPAEDTKAKDRDKPKASSGWQTQPQ